MKKIVLLMIMLLTPVFLFAQEAATSAAVVSKIEIQGNSKVSTAKIISNIKSRAGQEYNENIINEDIKSLTATGFFETVEVQKTDTDQGAVLTFKVKEKAVLKKLDVLGTKFIRKNKIIDTIGIKQGGFVDEFKLKEAETKVKDLYSQKGFADNQVSYTIVVNDKNEAEVVFNIIEKKVLKIRAVSFSGNKNFSGRRLQKLIKTKRAWLFNKGAYQQDVVKDDKERIMDFYRLQGYSDVQVVSDVRYEAKGVYVSFNVSQGKQYFIGEIKVDGCEKISLSEVKKVMQLRSGAVFSEQAVFEEATRMREVYMDKGYIFVSIEPANFYNTATDRVDIDFKIVENNVAYVERIDIKGNVKTKDKVIRRELRIYPQDRFDGQKIKKSKQRLDNLGYFEEVRFGTEAANQAEPDKVNLITEVKESKTGSFSFGGGYSSVDQFLGFVEVRQRNFDYKNWKTFTGGGQDLSAQFSLGSVSQNMLLSFTNPWILDTPWSFGFDLYRKIHDKDSDVGYGYRDNATGGDIRFTREFTDEFKTSFTYRLEQVKISDVDSNASQDLKDEEGTSLLSTGEIGLAYDTRDNPNNPTTGFLASNTLQLTGGLLLGDRDFYKDSVRLVYDKPLVKKSVMEYQIRAGFGDAISGSNKIPVYERYFVGGASTVRGYRERKIGPIDANSDPIGGESMFVGNVEYTYPFVDFIKGAVFFDSGNVWAKNTDFLTGGLKSSYGLGLRLKTPIGPLSVDYGIPLNKESGSDKKSSGRFHFNISKGF